MTIALIVIIAFFAIGFIQKDNINKKMAIQKKISKTNATLQKQIEANIKHILNKEIDQLISSGLSKDEALAQLHQKYNIPRRKDVGDSVYKWHVNSDLEINLYTLMTKREMARLGYQYSNNGKESKWQENQKSNEEFQDIKNKYPWL